jgi:two-component system alkaline phosphatase synthesis response regulator PhoP
MIRVLIITGEKGVKTGLAESLVLFGFSCSSAFYSDALEQVDELSPHLVLVELDGNTPDTEAWDIMQLVKEEKHVPVIALVPSVMLEGIDNSFKADDFLTAPYDAAELSLRAGRLLNRGHTESGEMIASRGLMIDLVTCEVAVDGQVLDLTFKEYELLKLLAGNPGRVYTRDDLLNKIWGYDYFGGDRTVDVHIRRLRSKIEATGHTFIETVRNIGYRFRKES